jgi:large subunit ribosomal protein L14
MLKVADNTGVNQVMCISINKKSGSRFGEIGDVITGTVKKCTPQSKIRKGAKIKAVIVRTKRDIQRDDGSIVRFDDNSVVLVDEAREPVGNRIFGPVARELRQKNFMRIISLAPEGVGRGRSRRLGIKKGDTVEVISGSDRYKSDPSQKRGVVRRIVDDKKTGSRKVLVENINMVFKHMKPSQMNPKGGRIEKESPLPVSKVMLVCPGCSKTTRVKVRNDESGVKTRYCMHCDKNIDTGK